MPVDSGRRPRDMLKKMLVHEIPMLLALSISPVYCLYSAVRDWIVPIAPNLTVLLVYDWVSNGEKNGNQSMLRVGRL